MSRWVTEQLTGGVVKTREPSMLQPGELVSASGVRLRPGDLTQLHLGRGTAEVGPDVGSSDLGLVNMFYLNFEDDSEFLLIVETQNTAEDGSGGDYTAVTFIKLDDETLRTRAAAEGRATKADIVHRGNQYLLGTDVRNWVVDAPAEGEDWPQLREQGFEATTQTIVGQRGLPGVGTWNDDPDSLRINYILELLYPAADQVYVNETEFKEGVKFAFQRLLDFDPFDPTEGVTEVLSVTLVVNDAAAFVYWVSEYDSVSDVQAAASTPTFVVGLPPAAARWGVRWRIGDRYLESELPLSQSQVSALTASLSWVGEVRNETVDKWRLYRATAGPVEDFTVRYTKNGGRTAEWKKDSDGVQRAREYVAGDTALVGGLLTELDRDTTSYVDVYEETGTLDPPISYPLVVATARGLVKLDPYLVKPNPWVSGALFSDALVMVDAANRQFTYYTYPGDVEYQPRSVYRELIVTDKADQVQGAIYMGDRVYLLTAGGIHAFNYLAYEGEAFRDSQQETITRRHGCVGRQAFDTVELEGGEFLVWLSPHGLIATDGYQWRDMCPDWRVEDAVTSGVDLSRAVLVNDPIDFAVRLYVPAGTGERPGFDRWDFYYHPSLLKGGDGRTAMGRYFRALGPTRMNGVDIAAAARGSNDGDDRVWLLTSDESDHWQVVRESVGEYDGTAAIATRRIYGPSPAATLNLRQASLQHNGPSNMEVDLIPVTQRWGQPNAMANGTYAMPDTKSPNRWASKHITGAQGNELQVVLNVTGSSWAIGPLWLDINPGKDADG